MEKITTAIILAGGKGLRLRPFTEKNPKVMVPVAGRPIADWQLSWLKRSGISHIIFAAGHYWEKINEHFGDGTPEGIKIEYSVEDKPLGTGGCLKMTMKLASAQTLLALNGDVLTDLSIQRMAKFHHAHHAVATLLAVPFASPYGMVHVSADGLAEGFVEKPVFPDSWINGGIYLLTRDILAHLPATGDIETATFPKLAKKGRIAAFRYKGFWRAVDTVKDLQTLDSELVSRNLEHGRGAMKF
ncbi:MAG: NDP-sugar synthase [Candidatus Bathyarchaeia archaeon]